MILASLHILDVGDTPVYLHHEVLFLILFLFLCGCLSR